jgi:hypothetical protein
MKYCASIARSAMPASSTRAAKVSCGLSKAWKPNTLGCGARSGASAWPRRVSAVSASACDGVRGTAGSVLAQPPISSSHASSTTPNRRRVMAVGVAVGIRRVGQVASDAFPLLGHGHGAQARRGDGSTAHAVVKLQIADPARHHGRRDVELAGARREAVPGHRLLERAH